MNRGSSSDSEVEEERKPFFMTEERFKMLSRGITNRNCQAKALILAFSNVSILFLCLISTLTLTAQNAEAIVWEEEVEISKDQSNEIQVWPSIAIDDGKLHVIWIYDDGTGNWDVHYRHFDGISWQAIMNMAFEYPNRWQTTPAVSANGGKAHAIWYELTGAMGLDLVHRYYDGTAWRPEYRVNSDIQPWWHRPSIASRGTEAFAVWEDASDGDRDIHYSNFEDWIWYAEQEVSNDTGTESQEWPMIAVGDDKVHIVWMDMEDGDSDIYYRSHNWTEWQPEQEISMDSGSENQIWPSIAAEGDKVHVVWVDDGDGDYDIHYKCFNGTDWQPAVEVSTDRGTEDQGNPSVAVDGSRVHVVWEGDGDGDDDIYYRYFNGTNWAPEQEISTDTGSELQYGAEVVAENGIVYVVWTDSGDGDRDIYLRRGVDDLQQPESNAIPNSVYWQTTSTFDIQWTATDNYSLANISLFYRHSPDNSSWSSWEEWAYNNSIDGTSATGNFTFTSPYGDGYYEFYTVVSDSNGNIEDAPMVADTIVGLDTSPPIGSIIINGGDVWTNSISVNLTLTFFDSTSGAYQVRFGNDGVWDTEPWEFPSSSKSWSMEAGDGTKTVYYQIRDMMGWESATFSDDINLDATKPTGLILVNGGAVWTSSSSVALELAYSDALSGASQVRYSNDGTWDTELWELPSPTKAWTLTPGHGLKTVFYQVRDNAGMESDTCSDNISLDATRPYGSIIINNGDAWTDVRPIALALTYSDDHSGVTEVRYSNDGIWDTERWENPTRARAWVLPVGEEGVRTVHYQIRDAAGLLSTYTDDISLDVNMPIGSITINDGEAWTNSYSVTLSLLYFDFSSGVDQIRFSNDGVWDTEPWEFPSLTKAWTLAAGNGTKTVFYQIRDNVSRLSVTYWDHISVDRIEPIGSIIVNNRDRWTTSTSVTLTTTYSDGLSGVSQVRYSNDGVWDTESWEAPSGARPWTLDPGDGTKTVYYQIRDNVGLLSTTFSDEIELDTTSPVIQSIVPDNGSAEVETTANITLTFSERMNDFETRKSFRLREGTTEIDGSVGWDDDRRCLVFTPHETLKNNTTYRVTVTTDAKDLAGNSFSSAWETSFTTKRGEDKHEDGPIVEEDNWWAVLLLTIVLVTVVLSISAIIAFRRRMHRQRTDEKEISEEEMNY